VKGTAPRAHPQAALDLVDELFDLPPAERDARLLRADPEVRAQAMRLLEADAREGDPLSRPAGAILPSALAGLERDWQRAGRKDMQVGPFRLESLLGDGGMGEVWVATRTTDFQQKVAVKLLHAWTGAALAQRFRLERQILARLSHPRIATLLDGGVTEEGQPWLAMELVEGLPLTEHCAARGYGVDERLRLFLQVCDAVEYAHQNLVVHRDLKPRNILVSASDEVKLLDFGIAKLLRGEEGEPTALTHTGERPMTPDYAAPEQIRGGAVTTTTDVWALGVLLHELLTGARPYRAEGKPLIDVERAVLEGAPPRPSSRIESKPLKRRVRGDLDAIVLKALQPRPSDRYLSVSALASDVRRHLDGLPVAARGDATAYVVRSFVRRYRAAVGVSAVVFGALVVGLVGTLWQAHRAREEARNAEQTRAFLVDLLETFDPYQQGGRPVTQRDILLRGEARVSELGNQPEVQAQLLRVFAQTWTNMGELERARPTAERALAVERSLAPRSLEVAKTLLLLGDITAVTGTWEDTGRDYAEALSIAREAEGPEGSTTAEAVGDLAYVARWDGRFAESEKLYREQIDIDRRVHGAEGKETLEATGDLAAMLCDAGRLAESEDLDRRVALLDAKVVGENHPGTLIVRANLAHVLIDGGRPDEAEAILRDVYDRQVAVVGENSPYTLNTLYLRGRAIDGLGRAHEAVDMLEKVLRSQTELRGATSREVARTLEPEAIALDHLGRLAEAETAARRALAIHVELTGEPHIAAALRTTLASVLLDEGRPGEARALLEDALSVEEKLLIPTHPQLVRTRAELARASAMTGTR
jgi:eukaryotic-like serine/threonine-protein kinase